MLNRTNQKSIQFYFEKSKTLKNHIWNEIESGAWSKVDPLSFEFNSVAGLLERTSWKPVIEDIHLIDEQMVFDHEAKKFRSPTLTTIPQTANLTLFLEAAEALFAEFSGKKVGVQCSGGLDSSLIIGLLRHFNIPHSLIGMRSERYEFRTERFIQEQLSKDCDSTIFIGFEGHLPMTGLDDVPAHQYPDTNCLNFSQNNAMANACKDLGVEVLISGAGGDVVLGSDSSSGNCEWQPGIFHDNWTQDLVYGAKGICVYPFFSNNNIANCLWNLRLGHIEDIEKKWARSFFSNFLPKELIDYSYRADFWGLYIDGMINCIPKMVSLQEEVFRLTQLPYFSPRKIEEFRSLDFLECDQPLYQRSEARLSLAIWLGKLLKLS